MRFYLVFALVFCVCGLSSAIVRADVVVVKQLAPGISLTQEIRNDLTINVLSVDTAQPGVHIETAIGARSITAGTGDPARGRDTVSSVVQRTRALAGVNADYFGGTGDPLGLGITNGDLYSEPWKTPRAAFGLDATGRTAYFGVLSFAGVLSAEGKEGSADVISIDRPLALTDHNDMVVYNQLYGPVSGGRPGAVELIVNGVNLPLQPNKLMTGTVDAIMPSITAASPIPDDGIVFSASSGSAAARYLLGLNRGDRIHFVAAIAPASDLRDALNVTDLVRGPDTLPSRSAGLSRNAMAWANALNAVGGGPRLLVDGKVDIDGYAEGFNDGFVNGPHARTAVGATPNGKIFLVAVEGKPFVSSGVSLYELASILLRYGAVNAINLDGGGSTTMDVGGVTVNYPSEGMGERRVADTLLVFGNRPEQDHDKDISLIGPDRPIKVGTFFELKVRYNGSNLGPDDSLILWAGPVTGGIGNVTQDGIFHALRRGYGLATAIVHGQKLTAPITVSGPEAAPETYKIAVTLSKSPVAMDRSDVSIRVSASSGAPGVHIPVQVIVVGGSAEHASLTTDEDGLASTTITWSGTQGGSVSIISDKTETLRLEQPTEAK